MKKENFGIVKLALFAIYLSVFASQEISAQETYSIGDIGPAGGIIFYDKGYFSEGWRYLEAAPASTEFTAAWWPWDEFEEIWFYYRYSLDNDFWEDFRKLSNITGTSTSIGTGKRNTNLIIAQLNSANVIGAAAQMARAVNFGGYTDWFLPSQDELDLMYQNRETIGELAVYYNVHYDYYSNRYWSSSQSSSTLSARSQHLGDGIQSNDLKSNQLNIRVVRSF